MRNLVVCCDGTWNTEETDTDNPTPTNVVKLRNCVAEKRDTGERQLVYYHTGVGTEGGALNKLAGGLYGKGISQNIKSAYNWLARTYTNKDSIYLFGFSRGAYTVRSLGGMLSAVGLLDLGGNLKPEEAWKRVDAAYHDGYREGKKNWSGGNWKKHHTSKTPIRFIGVWDTVGALGIPDDLLVLNLFDRPSSWMFHDTKLGANVETARHAVAIDEERGPYAPTLWTNRHADMKQVWFPGVHSDVGGGYDECGLANIALKWMIDEAAGAGLAFEAAMTDQIEPDPRGLLHRSNKGVWKALRSQPRPVPSFRSSGVHESARQRQKAPPLRQAPYWPTKVLAPNEEDRVDVFARERWNITGFYLEKGEYELSGKGQWLDKSIPCGPEGGRDGRFHPGEVMHLIGSGLGKLENLWKKARSSDDADFKLTRRHEDIPWFALTGVIAHKLPKPSPDGTPASYESFKIGTGCRVEVTKPGYLYAYANDAWDFYGNNRGSVELTVKRVK